MRLFYALMPTDETVAALQETMGGVAGARWQSAAQLHLTLRFIGDVAGPLVDDLVSALPADRLRLEPLTLSGVGFFEKDGRANALWVRVLQQPSLTALHQRLDRACQAIGLESEHRAYRPHVTVARLPRTAGPIGPWIEQYAGFAMDPAPFSRCSLVESILTKDGSHYEEIASHPLG